jgi:hypothetical protein
MKTIKVIYRHPLSGDFLGSHEQRRPYDDRGWRSLRLTVKDDLDFYHKHLLRKEGMLPRPLVEFEGAVIEHKPVVEEDSCKPYRFGSSGYHRQAGLMQTQPWERTSSLPAPSEFLKRKPSKRFYNLTPEGQEAKREKMREYWRKKKAAELSE